MNEAQSYLILVNLETGEVQQIDQQVWQISWSPDSSNLAFTVSDYADMGSGFVYDIKQNTLTILKLTFPEPDGFVWSSDSLQLVVWDSTGNNFAIDLVSLPNLTITKSIDISSLASPGSDSLCTFQASPDMHFVTFVADCTAGYFGTLGRKDVYVWNTETNAIRQLTHLTDFVSKMCRMFLGCGSLEFTNAFYYAYWLSNSQILVGSRVGRQDDSCTYAFCSPLALVFQTAMFDVPNTGDSRIAWLSKGVVASVAINPVSGQFALLTQPDVYDIENNWHGINQVAIGPLTPHTIGSVWHLPNADSIAFNDYNGGIPTFFWSPDGKYLTYHEAGRNAFVFIDSAQTDRVHYRFDDSLIAPDESGQFTYINEWYGFSYVFPIGWVVG